MVYLFLAEGFEEIEALTPVDMLRRAEIDVTTVGIGGRVITGAHDITVTADIDESLVKKDIASAVILPGGAGGTKNLGRSETVRDTILHCNKQKRLIAAICAAPSILGGLGLLSGKAATAFPSFQDQLGGAHLSEDHVVCDGNIITARGMGVSIEFSAAVIAFLKDRKTADQVLASIQMKGC